MRKSKIALLDDYQGIALKRSGWGSIQEKADVVAFTEHFSPEELPSILEQFDIIVAMRERTVFDEALFRKLPNLKYLITTGNRNRSIDLAAAAAHNVTVSGAPGSGLRSTAELTWTLLLASQKNLIVEHSNVFNGHWQTTVGCKSLDISTLGVIGFGRIGKDVANIGKAFGMRVIAWSQNLDPNEAKSAGVEPMPSLDLLLETSDIVTLHLVSSTRTRHILNENNLTRLKPNALIVNTSRGPLIDENALVKFLKEGKIRAGLDVFDIEPLPKDSPFRKIDPKQLVLTPHIGYGTEDTYDSFYKSSIEDIQAWFDGKPINVLSVDKPAC